MSLLLLFHGAPPAAARPGFDLTPNSENLPRAYGLRAATLTVAVVATTLSGYVDRVPDREFRDGWRSQFSTPVVLNKTLNAALLDSGFKPIMPPRVPNREFQDGWRHRFTDPPAQLVKVLSTAANSTGWMPVMPPRVPERQFQDGWSNLWQGPSANLAARRATNLVESWGYPEFPPVAAAAYTDLIWTQWQDPSAYRIVRLTTAVADTGWQQYLPPQIPNVEYQEGWRHRWTDPPSHLQRQRSVDLLGQVIWSAQVANVEYQEGWRSQFPTPPKPAPRSLDLLGEAIWAADEPPAVVIVYQEGWRSSFGEPPKPAPRSPELLGQAIWPAQVANVQFQEGWRSRFTEPPKPPARSVDLLGQAIWAAKAPDVFQEGWRQEFSRPSRLSPQPRLEGQISWPAQVARTEYQDGWRCRWQEPPVWLQPRRPSKLLEGWDWPGAGYSFVQVAQTPSDWWRTQWQDPPAYSRSRPRAADLGPKGGVVHGRVPDREFQDGWRSAFSQPPIYAQPKPRLAGEIARSRVPDREFQEGWRSRFAEPQRLGPLPRQQGYVSWPGIGYSFVIQTPTTLWWPKWQEPPHALQAKRSVALFGQFGWDPQVVVQVTPPVAEPGVCVSFSVKRAPKVTKGLRTGPTTQMVLARGSFSLSFGLKHQCEPPTTIIATVTHGEVPLETETEVDLLTENKITLESES